MPVGHGQDGTKVPKGSCQLSAISFQSGPLASNRDQRSGFDTCVSVRRSLADGRWLTADGYLALAAIFLTMARTSLRSLSFRLTE